MSDVLTTPQLIHPAGVCGWTLNTYRACGFSCRYCLTSSPGEPVPVFGRDDVVDRLREELEPVPADGMLSLGTIADAYPPVEEEHQITRAVVAELVESRRGFVIVTKSPGVRRDLDLLVRNPAAAVTVSLFSADEGVVEEIDVGAPSVAERLALLRDLVDAGISTLVSASPWIPGRSDIASLVARLEAEIGPDVPVMIGALDVNGPLARFRPFNRRFDQREIDLAYLDAYRAASERPNVRWNYPVLVATRHPELSLTPMPLSPDELDPEVFALVLGAGEE